VNNSLPHTSNLCVPESDASPESYYAPALKPLLSLPARSRLNYAVCSMSDARGSGAEGAPEASCGKKSVKTVPWWRDDCELRTRIVL